MSSIQSNFGNNEYYRPINAEKMSIKDIQDFANQKPQDYDSSDDLKKLQNEMKEKFGKELDKMSSKEEKIQLLSKICIAYAECEINPPLNDQGYHNDVQVENLRLLSKFAVDNFVKVLDINLEEAIKTRGKFNLHDSSQIFEAINKIAQGISEIDPKTKIKLLEKLEKSIDNVFGAIVIMAGMDRAYDKTKAVSNQINSPQIQNNNATTQPSPKLDFSMPKPPPRIKPIKKQ